MINCLIKLSQQSPYWGDHDWQMDDADDKNARKAYESLLRYNINNNNYFFFMYFVEIHHNELNNFHLKFFLEFHYYNQQVPNFKIFLNK